MHSTRIVLGALALALLLGGAFGCKTGTAGKLPVSSPMVHFEAPEAEDLFPEPEADEGVEGPGAGDEE